jgi:hypothetical protein
MVENKRSVIQDVSQYPKSRDQCCLERIDPQDALTAHRREWKQYPLYDALAMGVQMMVFTYLLGRTDAQGRSLIEAWSDSRTQSRARSSMLSIAAFIVIGHAVYLSVFAPHLATKLMGLVTVGPTEQLFEDVPNQPL